MAKFKVGDIIEYRDPLLMRRIRSRVVSVKTPQEATPWISYSVRPLKDRDRQGSSSVLFERSGIMNTVKVIENPDLQGVDKEEGTVEVKPMGWWKE